MPNHIILFNMGYPKIYVLLLLLMNLSKHDTLNLTILINLMDLMDYNNEIFFKVFINNLIHLILYLNFQVQQFCVYVVIILTN